MRIEPVGCEQVESALESTVNAGLRCRRCYRIFNGSERRSMQKPAPFRPGTTYLCVGCFRDQNRIADEPAEVQSHVARLRDAVGAALGAPSPEVIELRARVETLERRVQTLEAELTGADAAYGCACDECGAEADEQCSDECNGDHVATCKCELCVDGGDGLVVRYTDNPRREKVK